VTTDRMRTLCRVPHSSSAQNARREYLVFFCFVSFAFLAGSFALTLTPTLVYVSSFPYELSNLTALPNYSFLIPNHVKIRITACIFSAYLLP
jgi:hypothetical protein